MPLLERINENSPIWLSASPTNTVVRKGNPNSAAVDPAIIALRLRTQMTITALSPGF